MLIRSTSNINDNKGEIKMEDLINELKKLNADNETAIEIIEEMEK